MRALEEPLRQIVANAGAEPSVVLNRVAEGEGNFGYNASNDTYGDLVEMGVLDPTKVTRCALENAASVATLILTTDAMVAELPKDEGHRHAAWAGWATWNGYVVRYDRPSSGGYNAAPDKSYGGIGYPATGRKCSGSLRFCNSR